MKKILAMVVLMVMAVVGLSAEVTSVTRDSDGLLVYHLDNEVCGSKDWKTAIFHFMCTDEDVLQHDLFERTKVCNGKNLQNSVPEDIAKITDSLTPNDDEYTVKVVFSTVDEVKGFKIVYIFRGNQVDIYGLRPMTEDEIKAEQALQEEFGDIWAE